MNRNPAMAVVAACLVFGLTVAACVIGVPLLVITTMHAQAADCQVTGQPAPSVPAAQHWDSRQTANATVIVAVGKRLNVAPRGYVVALATAIQESTLYNRANTSVPKSMTLPHEGAGHDHDSVGLFQQRPNPPDGQGSWGTVQELMTPSIAAEKFYTALLKVPGWAQMPLTDAAQAVQHSAYPNAYAAHETAAAQLAAYVLGLPNLDVIGGSNPYAPCGPGEFGPVPVAPGGWVQPINAYVVSPYGQRDGRLHAGVDLGYPGVRGQPIRAAAAGVVQTAHCDASTGNCDIDGSPNTPGCGWMIDIIHPNHVATRYCHLIRQPYVTAGQTVTAGQVIGLVGTSGHSSGPHLHYQVHTGVPSGGRPSNDNSTDPVRFMQAVGAPLGTR